MSHFQVHVQIEDLRGVELAVVTLLYSHLVHPSDLDFEYLEFVETTKVISEFAESVVSMAVTLVLEISGEAGLKIKVARYYHH